MRNFNHLYYFYVVAKLGSVTAAARELNTSQSSLSMQLKTLEDQLGRTLFDRTGRTLSLTPIGQQVSHYCKRMFDVAGELDGFLHRREHHGRASFSIGVSPDIERPYVTDNVAIAMAGLPKAKPIITLVSHPHEKLIAKLELGDLDVVLSSQPIHSNTARSLNEVLLPVKAIAAVPKGKSLKMLFREESTGLVLPTVDMKIRWEADEFLTKKKVRKNIAFESNVMGAIVRACVDGLGIGFLPEAYVQTEIKRGTLTASRESLWNHRLYLSSRKTLTAGANEEVSSMVHALSTLLTRTGRQ